LPRSDRVYARSVQFLSGLILALGLAILVVTVASGGGPLSTGVLLGLAFTAVGVGRLYIAGRGRR